jgi:signal transduction histidine kinase/CRP-like cAMP-binding protein
MDQQLLETLKKNRLFLSVPDEYFDHIKPFVQFHLFKKGEYIFKQGEEDNRLWLVVKGRIGIYNPVAEGGTVLLVEIEGGDYFGELELLDGLPRSADAKAHTKVELLTIPSDVFHSVLERDCTISNNVLQQLSLRLRKTNQLIAAKSEQGTPGKEMQPGKMERLIEAAKSVNSSLNLDTVLEIILDTAVQATNADRGTLYLIDQSNNEIWSKLLFGEHVGEIRLPIGTGIAGFVAETGETVNIEDTYNHPYFNPDIDQRSGYHTDSMLCMPMRSMSGEIIGVFQLLNKSEGVFNADDENFIEGLSAHAAIALENAHLHKSVVQNERLSVVGRMANTVIHDLKSPINTIKAYTKMLRNESGNEEAVTIADEVILQADRLIKMVQEILDYSKGNVTIEMNRVNVEDLIMTMFRFLDKDFKERNITIDTDLGYTGEWSMDADKMIRVLFNIAGNAADAMKEGGAFIIRTAEDNNSLKFELSDTGIGMSPEIQSRLFEPFFTHGKRYGTGLGMAIVKKIVEDHNGTISVQSEEGKGTTFTIVLPRN